MKQYLDLAKAVIDKGTYKAPSREGMPGTTSLFGYQFRCDLSEGFPLLTTKKVSFKNIVHELLWFLKGDTNIKYLVDNGCNIWNEDAYNYYCKRMKELDHYLHSNKRWHPISFIDFVQLIKDGEIGSTIPNYKFGDCGKQYGWLWRNWEGESKGSSILIDVNMIPSIKFSETEKSLIELRSIAKESGIIPFESNKFKSSIDQIKNIIEGLKNNPESRRHIISAWNPATLDDMALNACHALVQFNCRPLTEAQKEDWRLQASSKVLYKTNKDTGFTEVDHSVVPEYYLDCQMYQRSADVFLGVPFNIASYALLTHILAKICNMVPGDFIHTFGDVHIYDNHMDQIETQLSRETKELPTLKLAEDIDWENYDIDKIWDWGTQLFELKGYDPHPAIKGKLSTGLR
jgi:thymidylate synthase